MNRHERRRRLLGLGILAGDGSELTPKGEQLAEELHDPNLWPEPDAPDDGMDPEPYPGGSLV